MVRSWIAEAVGVPCKFTFGSVYKFNIIVLTLLGLISNMVKGEGIGIGSSLGILITWGLITNLVISGIYSLSCKMNSHVGIYVLAVLYLLVAWNVVSVPKKEEPQQQAPIVIPVVTSTAPATTSTTAAVAPAPQKADAFFKAYDEMPL